MRYIELSLKVLAAAVLLVVPSGGSNVFPDEPIPGEAVLSLSPDANLDSVLIGSEAYYLDSISNYHTFLIGFPVELPVDTVIGRLQYRAGVQHVHANYRHALPEVLQMSQSFPDQNAPVFLSGVSPEAYYEQAAPHTTACDSASLLEDGDSIVVGLIDNGIDMSHPLLEASIEPYGYDFVNDDDDPSEETGELYGHGTFVAGLVKLVAPGARLAPLRAFDSDGYGTTYEICKALYRAIEYDVDVVNMSFGFYSYYPILDAAVHDALGAGITLVAAAGNDGVALASYPAMFDGVIAVGAIDSVEVLADFSNFGEFLDLCAPGVNVYSSLAGDYDWGTWSGTSFAAPQVSGICALVLARDETVTPYAMEMHIRTSARKQLLWGTITPPDYLYGYGCLDGYASVLAYTYGDLNNSGEINLTDIVQLIAHLYLSGPPADIDERQEDFNCNGNVNMADVTSMVSHVYLGGQTSWPCYW